MQTYFSCCFYEQINGCATAYSLLVTFNDMNIVKLGPEKVLPQKPKFNRRHLDDIFKQL